MDASDFEKLFENGEYTADTRFILTSGKFDGNGATLNAPFGVEIISSDVILVNLNVKGKITVSGNVSNVIIRSCSADAIISYGSYVEIEKTTSREISRFRVSARLSHKTMSAVRFR